MNRRTALAIAAAAGGTVLTATAAFATNVGLLDRPDEPPMSVLDASSLVGDETPLVQDPTVVTIVVEDPPATVAPATAPVSSPAAATASAAGGDDSAYDDSYDDDVYDDHGEDDDGEDHEDDDHEDEDHEVEDDD